MCLFWLIFELKTDDLVASEAKYSQTEEGCGVVTQRHH